MVAGGALLISPNAHAHHPNPTAATASPIAGASGSIEGTTAGHEGTRDTAAWFRWTSPFDGAVRFHTCGVTFSTILEVYAPTAFGLVLVTENAFGTCDRGTTVVFRAIPGGEYLVRVRGPGRFDNGTFPLTWEPVDRPANDDFDAAVAIGGDAGTTAGTLHFATHEQGETNRTLSNVWYRWTATHRGWVHFETTRGGLHAFTGETLGSLVRVASGSALRMTFIAMPGTTYSIAVTGNITGFASPLGSEFELSWVHTFPPENDEAANAAPLDDRSGSVTGTSVDALPDFPGANGVWYRWNAPDVGRATFRARFTQCPSPFAFFGAGVTVFTGDSHDALAAVGSGSARFCFSESSFSFPTTPRTYWILVAGALGNAGPFALSWAFELTDSIPPSVSATPSPLPNANGWNNDANVAVAFSATDGPGGTGVASLTCWADGAEPLPASTVAEDARNIVVSAEGVTTVSCVAHDRADNQSQALGVPVRIDRTAPTVVVARSPGPNANGWNNEPVEVEMHANDGLSGVDGDAAFSRRFEAEGMNQATSREFVDRAGNSTAGSIGGINIDLTPPTLSCATSPSTLWPPNHQLVDVLLEIGLTDALSGPATWSLDTATSDEPDDGLGDGGTTNDIQGADIGEPDTSVRLRAERSGAGEGRVYTLSSSGSDLADNAATCSATVVVPHRRP